MDTRQGWTGSWSRAAAIQVIGDALTLLPFVKLSSALDSSWQSRVLNLNEGKPTAVSLSRLPLTYGESAGNLHAAIISL